MLGMFHLCLASTPSQSVDLQIPEGTLSEKPWPDNYERDLEDGHAHEFVLKSEVAFECRKLISPLGRAWWLHPPSKCAELPTMEELHRVPPPESRTENPPRYDFTRTYKWKTCRHFSNSCPHCLLESYILSGLPRPWTSSLILSSCHSNIIFNPMDYRSCLKNLLCS